MTPRPSSGRAFPPRATGPTTPKWPTPTPRSGRLLGGARRRRPARRHAGGRARRSRRAARRAPRAVARLLRLRRVGADSADHGRARHRAARGPRSGAHHRRDADRARAAGVPAPAAVQGTSLRPALEGERQELLAFAESWYPRYHYGWSELQAVRDGAFKFILAPTRELYDLAKDPGELTNLAGGRSGPRRSDGAGAAGAGGADHPRRRGQGAAGRGPGRRAAAARARLRRVDLGAAPRGSARGATRRRPSSSTTCCSWPAGLRGRAATTTAAAKVLKALAVDPEMIEGHTRLGNIYTKAGRHADASPPTRGRWRSIPRT